MPGILVIAEVHFETKTAAERNEFMKCFVISNKPRRDHECHSQDSANSWSQPPTAALVQAVPGPRSQERRYGHHHRIGQASETAEGTETNPVPHGGGTLEVQRGEKYESQ